MDWGLTANIAAVVVPTIGAASFVLDMRIRLLILENNDELLKRINGSYVKKEVFEDRLRTRAAK